LTANKKTKRYTGASSPVVEEAVVDDVAPDVDEEDLVQLISNA
jgi:hypothetical protein